jgi:diguanylate cyclase (GGDEF)-like protein
MSLCKMETEAARLLTRRAFQERGQADVERAKRYGRPLSCAMIDIDDFKRINDSHGHAAGDLVLRHVVAVCKAELRSVDYIGRVAATSSR